MSERPTVEERIELLEKRLTGPSSSQESETAKVMSELLSSAKSTYLVLLTVVVLSFSQLVATRLPLNPNDAPSTPKDVELPWLTVAWRTFIVAAPICIWMTLRAASSQLRHFQVIWTVSSERVFMPVWFALDSSRLGRVLQFCLFGVIPTLVAHSFGRMTLSIANDRLWAPFGKGGGYFWFWADPHPLSRVLLGLATLVVAYEANMFLLLARDIHRGMFSYWIAGKIIPMHQESILREDLELRLSKAHAFFGTVILVIMAYVVDIYVLSPLSF